ncbi:WD40/YVTN/BNR-like repeat-containing protein [Alicyclobacillus mengziensis]|uniref:Photosynthesis system II assembly factor Ycf48/Hcf136-like domain-containing protein n=1 Tax=Alicyclobacillus mengziensis TaxID=2931921 RepID=A0A9X7VWN2_9BACL|nr:hypothetical protein [Alicyclobacillus mengziensis]QSO46222.1 hypothetical protein JZ786_17155 [Alicyclobacillus mengziensis]
MKRRRAILIVPIALAAVLVGCGVSQPTPLQKVTTGVSNRPGTAKPNNSLLENPQVSQLTFFTEMNMLNSTTGFISGYYNNKFSMWITSDGGLHWRLHEIPGVPTHNVRSGAPPIMYFQSKNIGWIAWITRDKKQNVLTVLRTINGGRQWTKHTQEAPTVANYIEQIDFSSHDDGWIRAFSGGAMNQGDTTILRTTSGGKSWAMVSSTGGYIPNQQATAHALPELDVPMPMVFTNTKDGWVAVGNVVQTQTSQATLYHTQTAGENWYPVHLPVPKVLAHDFATVEYLPVFSRSEGTVLIQYQGKSNQVLTYHTTDSGKTWNTGTPLPLGKQNYTVRQSFLSPEEGWIIGRTGSALEYTINAGESWQRIPTTGLLKSLIERGYTVEDLDMVTTSIGWVMLKRISEADSKITTKVLETTDGGQAWKEQNVN